MGFDVSNFLGSLFGNGPAMVKAAVPEAADPPAAVASADWVRQPDVHGRMGWQAPDLPEVMPFDDLPLPGPPCPECGSLEQWQDALGRERCGNCEREILDKALELAERAAWLRKQAQPRKPATRITPRCVAAGQVDTLDLVAKRPVQGQLRGFGGV